MPCGMGPWPLFGHHGDTPLPSRVHCHSEAPDRECMLRVHRGAGLRSLQSVIMVHSNAHGRLSLSLHSQAVRTNSASKARNEFLWCR